MGIVQGLVCPKCRWKASTSDFRMCPTCGVVLEVMIETGHLTRSHLLEIRKRTDATIWRWFEFLPIEDRSSVVSLGEGYTPLVRSKRLGDELGIARLYLKNDALLPTGSLKDRSNAVGLSRARELGVKIASAISTGNAAASVAGYAAAAGMESVVLVPKGTSSAKILQAHAYGAKVVIVNADFEEAVRLYSAAVQQFGWYDCLSTNPYRNEGKKSYAYEVFDQLDEHVPNWVIHPTAGGTGLYAMWKGYNELVKLGWAHRSPKLVAAQSQAAAPIVASLERGLSHVEPVSAEPTIAESIRVGNPSAMGWRALEAVRDSKGTGVALSDEEILHAQSLLARLTGIFAEPAGATSVAAARKLREREIIGKGELVVCNITGHGLKQPAAVRVSDAELRAIPPDLEALKKRLGMEQF
jgi:threonine synthase